MKTTYLIRGFFVTLLGLSAILLAAGLSGPGLAQDKTPADRERIGVYDSRAVAVAYAGSSFQAAKMKALMARSSKAKEAGDTKEVARLEAEGRAWQKTMHQQGFGTAPVDDLLAHIAQDLPAMQEAAGVTRLISKWNTAELAKHPKAVQLDVTLQLVDAFHPNETQRKRAFEIQKKAPVKHID